MIKITQTLFFSGLLTVMNFVHPTVVSAHKKQHKAHVHGVGKLDVSIDKNEIELDFELPAEDILGFEHKPKDEKQKNAISAVRNKVMSDFTGITVPAGCDIQKRSFDMDYKEEGHAEVEVNVEYKCTDVTSIKNLEVLLFNVFPKIKKLNVNVVTSTVQKAVDLTPTNNKLDL